MLTRTYARTIQGHTLSTDLEARVRVIQTDMHFKSKRFTRHLCVVDEWHAQSVSYFKKSSAINHPPRNTEIMMTHAKTTRETRRGEEMSRGNIQLEMHNISW